MHQANTTPCSLNALWVLLAEVLIGKKEIVYLLCQLCDTTAMQIIYTPCQDQQSCGCNAWLHTALCVYVIVVLCHLVDCNRHRHLTM